MTRTKGDSTAVSIDDFANLLDVSKHPSLVHSLPVLGSKNESKRIKQVASQTLESAIDPESKKPKRSPKQKSSIRVQKDPLVPAPLPKCLKDSISRQAAYQDSSREVSKWSRLVKLNRMQDQLVFPLNKELEPDTRVNIRDGAGSLTGNPMTELQRSLAKDYQAAGINLPSMNSPEESYKTLSKNDKTQGLNSNDFLSFRGNAEAGQDAPGEDPLTAAMAARTRARDFYTQQRAKRHAKIKSKRFRLEVRKDKEKERRVEENGLRRGVPSAITDLLNEDQGDRRALAEIARATERVSLKSRKVHQWAGK
jgi:U3 small nucleolar RNA-associated protein 14